MPDSPELSKVTHHLRLYEHPLLSFSARETNGVIEVLIDLIHSEIAVPTYTFRLHPRDLDHPQLAWHLQRQLYDALHDYFIEMFISTPQDRTTTPNDEPVQPAIGESSSPSEPARDNDEL